ncbi:putative peptidoglycan lipid II flippase [Edaphobacter modestus]|uniref:Probable lipid II flippase MurJ n=1 Tax=Edaphobacter modestus TaxID=388466 RepID=A0A4Q7YVD4_9BACT|nr:putative peptidoglycan lipid II flippase [Edaphobacter modestus]
MWKVRRAGKVKGTVSNPPSKSVTPPHPKGLLARSSAVAVASGILMSRLLGLVRDRVFAHYLGNSDIADAFRAAFRIPNFLQNLFGEGVLSASFIPVYARLRAEERNEEASELAEAIFAILVLVTSVLVLVGVFAAPLLSDVIAAGFDGEKRALTIRLVRILFPGAALLVFYSWCLGVLNSHRKFLLSYAAPVVWNVTMIAAFLWDDGRQGQVHLAIVIAWASVIGSGLQFAVLLPAVLRLLRPLVLRLRLRDNSVRTVVRNFFPVFFGRGVVQVSAFLDSMIASFLPTSAVSALAYAQTLNSLPVSLFGMAVSAAELPAMSSALGSSEQVGGVLRERLAQGLKNIAFFVVPSAVAFLILGDVIVAAIYRTGQFTAKDVTLVWSVLAGSAVGLLASTSGRLYASAFYALRDTRTPLIFAVIRVVLTVALGYFFALPLPKLLGVDRLWGVAGLTFSAGLAGWVEFVLLRRELHRRIGAVPSQRSRTAKLWGAAVLAALIGYGAKRLLPIPPGHLSALTVGAIVLPLFGVLYLVFCRLLGIAAPSSLQRLFRRA